MQDVIEALLGTLAKLTEQLKVNESLYQQSREEALKPVSLRLQQLDELYGPISACLEENITEVQEAIKNEVLCHCASVKAHGWHAIYSQGRISWDDGFLQGYAAANPEILQARIEGKPSVSLRKAK